MDKIIDFLMEYGGDSIQYRVRRDILSVSSQTEQMVKLHDRIMSKPKVKKILDAQHEDGWIGNTLHGSPPDGFDSNVWKLLNFGVDKHHVIFMKAIHALLHPKEDEAYKRTFPGGPALDADGRGGDKSVVANILASLDYEYVENVTLEVRRSLDHFRGAMNYTSVDDFSVATRSGSRRYYKPKALFPGANHLRLLSATKQWRTSENIEMVKRSFIHCIRLMKDETQPIFFKSKTHFVGPFNFNWRIFPFSIDQINHDSYAMVWWLRTLQQCSTLGFVNEIPELASEYNYLMELLESEDLYKKQTEKSLQRFREIWSIEERWKQKEQVQSDLFFLALLILHQVGL